MKKVNVFNVNILLLIQFDRGCYILKAFINKIVLKDLRMGCTNSKT